MNRRKALKSVLALTAAAPVAVLAKAQEPHTLTIGIDSPAITEAMNDIAALQPKTGTFEWALQKMREGCRVHRTDSKIDDFTFSIRQGTIYLQSCDGADFCSPPNVVEGFNTSEIVATDWEIVT